MKKIFVSITILFAAISLTFAQTTKSTPAKITTTKTAKAKKTKKTHTATAKMNPTTNTDLTKVQAAPAAKGAVATFEKTEIDYGKITQGSEPLRVFTFKNTGSEPLIISNAAGSCGCTVPTFPKEPIMPGQSSKIEVRYDTQRVGAFTKTVTLTTNEANPTRVLTIKGDVSANPNSTEPAKN